MGVIRVTLLLGSSRLLRFQCYWGYIVIGVVRVIGVSVIRVTVLLGYLWVTGLSGLCYWGYQDYRGYNAIEIIGDIGFTVFLG